MWPGEVLGEILCMFIVNVGVVMGVASMYVCVFAGGR